jgi:hypothetical protein
MQKMRSDYEDKCARVRTIIETTIADLEGVGLDHEAALRLLVTQAIIRMADTSETVAMLRHLQDGTPSC